MAVIINNAFLLHIVHFVTQYHKYVGIFIMTVKSNNHKVRPETFGNHVKKRCAILGSSMVVHGKIIEREERNWDIFTNQRHL